ncbi:MAG: MgtC/SapB family protein [Weeksellaceae bacterium]
MLEWNEVLIRLVMASVFGALVGLERERKNWSAGLRTHMLVCVGSCLFMIVSAFGFGDVMGNPHMDLDPSRVAAQVVSGIGFIGAGTILFQKEGTVRGLTTAAGLWTVAGIGLAAGGGMYVAAAMTTVLVLVILWALQPIEKKYAKGSIRQNLRIITQIESNEVDVINDILTENNFIVESFNLSKSNVSYIFEIKFESADAKKMAHLIKQLRKLDSVKEVFWSK